MNIPNEILYLIREKYIYNSLLEFKNVPIQEISPNILDIAYRYDFFNMFSSDDLSLEWAASKGYLPIVKWLYSHSRVHCSAWAINWAAANGHLHVIIWLHENGKNSSDECDLKMNTFAMDMAAKHGHFHIVRWLSENGYRCTTAAEDFANEYGHFEIVEFLKNQSQRIRVHWSHNQQR